jgi:uncharacterized protein
MVIVDTGPLVAAADSDDDGHRSCVDLLTGLRLGATDAPVIAIAERLGISEVATLGHRHFTVVRPTHVPDLTLLA